ncbi:hypothetical protein ACFL6M_06455 [Candidatus Eisenbacteria bacterium]|uniref:Uncharacterized protein n=1 Tax=Eiseniibacteriota bacterium TaxID=2212470 RepID=A0ABV6YLM2_UNCEI
MKVLLCCSTYRFFFAGLILLPVAIRPSSAAEWKGKRIVKDDIVHVVNPADPMEPPAVMT